MPRFNDVVYPSMLANLFSSSFVNKIISNEHVPYMRGVFQQTRFHIPTGQNLSVKSALLKVFSYLSTNYRCEYVYKTAILKEVLLKRHDLVKSTYLTEFRSFNAKADIVILNGTSTVYEIKSDIDRLDRLLSQILAYQKVFDKVFVVSNEENFSKILSIVPRSIGLIILQPDLTISTRREATSNINHLDKRIMFDSLRKNEYFEIIRKEFGKTPNVPSTRIHSFCKNLFDSLPNVKAQHIFVETLKRRGLSPEQVNLVNASNLALKCLLTEKNYSPENCRFIKFGLNQKLLN